MLTNNPYRRPVWRRIADSSFANAMATPHGMGHYLSSINPMWSLDSQRLPAKITNIIRETDDAVTIELQPNGEWQGCKAGQFVNVTLEIDGRLQTRCYSISNSEYAPRPTITVKAKSDGFVSRAINQSLRLGDRLIISQAMGDFVLPVKIPARLLYIAGGSGITPCKSMIETLLLRQCQTEITLLYYNRSEQDSIAFGELSKLATQHPNFSLRCGFESGEAAELDGRFNRDHLPEGELPTTFCCGPAGLMDAVTAHYESANASDRLSIERFGSPIPSHINSDETGGEIRFKRSERLTENNGDNLLNQAEAAGLTPESGCRMGICHSCTCQKNSGSVRNLQTGEITHGEEQIRLCISQPLGDVALDI